MKRKYNTIISYLFISLFAVSLYSCEEEKMVDNTPDQLFRPVLFKAEVSNSTVEFSWTPIANASYMLEISRDSLSFQNELQSFLVDGDPEYIVQGLSASTLYSARIKAVSLDASIQDSGFKELTFTTD